MSGIYYETPHDGTPMPILLPDHSRHPYEKIVVVPSLDVPE